MNPRTTLQTTQRMILAAASAGWRGLTAVQRSAWAGYGAQLLRTDSLGATYTLTGLQAFTSAYRIATTLSQTTLTNAPAAPATLPTLTIGAVTSTA